MELSAAEQTRLALLYDQFAALHRGGAEPIAVRSPGRVNLIGEHVDYNLGFVLPSAVDRGITFLLVPNGGTQWNFHAADFSESASFDPATYRDRARPPWSYLLGVIDQLVKAGLPVPGVDCVFGGDVPIGAGMSSSAALEAGFAFALNELFDLGLAPLELVRIAHRAENEFVGVNCGVMDQFANIFGKEKSVLKIDCRSLEHEYVPFEREEAEILLCDTGVRRALAGSEYNVRRAQCEAGAAILRRHDPAIGSLRDATEDILESLQSEFDPRIFRRCRYVVRENARVIEACGELRRGNLASFGALMFETHRGLREEYEVSCPELDRLVEIAAGSEGVFGARMMGAGFGGCTINLVLRDGVDSFIDRVRVEYRPPDGGEASIYRARLSGGTHLVERG